MATNTFNVGDILLNKMGAWEKTEKLANGQERTTRGPMEADVDTRIGGMEAMKTAFLARTARLMLDNDGLDVLAAGRIAKMSMEAEQMVSLNLNNKAAAAGKSSQAVPNLAADERGLSA